MGTKPPRTAKCKAEKATFGHADGAYCSKVSARPWHGFCSKYGKQAGAAKPALRSGQRCGTARGFLRRAWFGGVLCPRRQSYEQHAARPDSSKRTKRGLEGR